MSWLVVNLAAAASLLSCSDGGPWACEEDGCPSPLVGCATLAADGLCTSRFSEIFEKLPPGADGTIPVQSACPHVCGRCDVSAPDECNIPRMDARTLTAEALASALVESETPVIVDGAMEEWLSGDSSSCWVRHIASNPGFSLALLKDLRSTACGGRTTRSSQPSTQSFPSRSPSTAAGAEVSSQRKYQ
jgi:hypothetical protein